jgi:tetratricopeptide (TPR) repeat protein
MAVELAPSIPSGYYSWGLALARHGDLAAAAAKFKHTNLKGPHWADPLKAWGDVLAAQGKIKEALGKYDAALKYALNWKPRSTSASMSRWCDCDHRGRASCGAAHRLAGGIGAMLPYHHMKPVADFQESAT